jgi:predicted RNA-binding Zn-ribbon protein involved in translation (DUF1610 family)
MKFILDIRGSMTASDLESVIQSLRSEATGAIEKGLAPDAKILEKKLVPLAKRLLSLVDDEACDSDKVKALLADLDDEETCDEMPWANVRSYAYCWALEREFIPKLTCVKCGKTDFSIMLWNVKTKLCHTCDPNLNWLDSQVIECQQCKNKLIWELHSGFSDGSEYYCDSCFRRVEVSLYDPMATECYKLTQTDTSEKYHFLVEKRLKECVCGGRYKFSASRRCLYCSAIIPSEETNRNVYPIAEENLKIEEYFFSTDRGDDIWK